MKKFIGKILTQKKVTIPLGILLLIGLSLAGYTTFGIYHNVKNMAASDKKETPYYPEYPKLNPAATQIDVIKRGEYLVKAGDCIACHTDTKKKGPAFAGGLTMKTPFGTIISPNITPDKTTGIGNWTEAQFIKAMREGISPQGHYYYPAFPYLYFNKISTADLKAIKTYLDNIPAVEKKNEANDMVFPFNIRAMQLGWRILFFNKENTGDFVENKKLSPEINRGAYLVQGLGHCAMCHTPSHHIINDTFSLGAPIRKYDLTGAKIDGYLAMNITHSNLAKIPVQEIVEVFTKNQMVGGGHVEGPMLEVNHDSLSYLTTEDLVNMASYLKSVKSEMPPKPKGGPGKATYESYCSGCHATGSGDSPKFGDASRWDKIVKNGIDKAYANAIHGVGNMPAKGACLSCSDDEIKQAVNFMVAAAQGGNVKASKPRPKQLTAADGKGIYERSCGVCHDSGYKGAQKPGDKKAWQPVINAGFVSAFKNVAYSQNGHPLRGNCKTCSDAEIKAANKYMMQQASDSKDYSLW